MPKPWEVPHMPKLSTNPRVLLKIKRWADLNLDEPDRVKSGVDRLRDYLKRDVK